MVKTRAGSKPQPLNKNINLSSPRIQKVNIQSRKTIIAQVNLNSQEFLTSSTLHLQKQESRPRNNSQ
ncbi:12707_t:CDS:1, partial [Funneliformis caledonium]